MYVATWSFIVTESLVIQVEGILSKGTLIKLSSLLSIYSLCFGSLFFGELIQAEEPLSLQHGIVAIEKDRFHAWPANNGIWQWDDEILVGFTQGDFELKNGHNIGGRQDSLLARSKDGGQTWKMFDPSGYLDDENAKYLGKNKKALKQPLNFQHADFALRIFATGYHGNDDPEGGFFYSYDRGNNWEGPFKLTGLLKHPELNGKILSPRTDYLVQSKEKCFIYISANDPTTKLKRLACIETTDGGISFNFVSWVTPLTNEFSGIMCQTVQISEKEFVLSYRKINADKTQNGTIDVFRSQDNCKTWQRLGTVKEMFGQTNPPALIKLQDGRLCCAYGDRYAAQMRVRYSEDNGNTWGPEIVIRDDFQSIDRNKLKKNTTRSDMGYPRIVQRTDGKLVLVYYWCTAKNMQEHIAYSIWKP